MTYVLVEKDKTGKIKTVACTAHAGDTKLCACLSLAIWGAIYTWQKVGLKFDIQKTDKQTATILLGNFSGWDDKSLAIEEMLYEQLTIIKNDFGEDSFVLDMVEG